MRNSSAGILGEKAPEWDVKQWLNLDKDQSLNGPSDLKGKVIYLYSFQAWCPGCHSSGFPSLVSAIDMFRDAGDVAFVAIQTVFEGFEANTFEKAEDAAKKYGLNIPVGHDTGADNSGSTVMRRYRSGGTPWAVVIGKDGYVYFNDFHAPTGPICKLIDLLRKQA